MNNQSNIEQTGNIGERLVVEYLKESGQYKHVTLSENKYDMHKDINADGIKIECKTRTVIRKHYAMPLELDQWYKADNCDKLFFITNPTSETEPVSIYESDGTDFFVLEAFGPRQTRTRMYDLNKMKRVKVIKDPAVIQQMYNLSVSKYKQ
jgi:hypothetical protein